MEEIQCCEWVGHLISLTITGIYVMKNGDMGVL